MGIDRRYILTGTGALATMLSVPAQAQHTAGSWNTSNPANVALELAESRALRGMDSNQLRKHLIANLSLRGKMQTPCNARLIVARIENNEIAGSARDVFSSKTFYYRGSMILGETMHPPESFFPEGLLVEDGRLIPGTMSRGPALKGLLYNPSYVHNMMKTYSQQKHVRDVMHSGFMFMAVAEDTGFACCALNVVTVAN